MASNFAVAARLFQFCAGPEKQTFYACEACLPELIEGPPICFLVIPGELVWTVDPEDEITCDLCREG